MKDWKFHAKGRTSYIESVLVIYPLCSYNAYHLNYCFTDSNDKVTCKRCLKILEFTSTMESGD